jgi:phenylacetate-CoA ligase
MGYTSHLATIADELMRRDLRLTRSLRAVVTIGETLSPARRCLIEEYFRAPIINRYGLRELGAWSAQNCPDAPEQFHVNTELVVWEIVHEDGTPAPPGEVGRVVLTDLHNYVMPFIRYDTGDLAVASRSGCACGRGFPLVGPIEGRSAEQLITPSGQRLSPLILGAYLKLGKDPFQHDDHLEAIRHYQLVEEAPGRVRFLVVPDRDFNPERKEKLREDMARLLGEGTTVTVETVDRIPPESSGKRPVIKLAQGSGSQEGGSAVVGTLNSEP